jgi:hypothetical protein
MNPCLPPPAGRRTKINEDKNEYQVIERVEREWYSHDPDLNGSDSDEEIEVWSDREGEVSKVDAQLDALIVSTEAGGVRAATLQGIADNCKKCDKIKLDLPATNLLNTPRVEVPWMLVLSFGSCNKPTRSPKNWGVTPKSVARGIPNFNSVLSVGGLVGKPHGVPLESSNNVGAVEFLEGLDEDKHDHPVGFSEADPDERTPKPWQGSTRPGHHQKQAPAGAAKTTYEDQGIAGGTAKMLSGIPIQVGKLTNGALVSTNTNEDQCTARGAAEIVPGIPNNTCKLKKGALFDNKNKGR